MSIGVFMDIVNRCNLKCASCPNCNSESFKNGTSSDVMSIKLFEKLIERLKSEGVSEVNLYNWTEPFLHQDLAKFITTAKDMGVDVNLSTNLQNIGNLHAVLSAKVKSIGVSVSGWFPHTYNRYHCGGDINVLQNNFLHLISLKNSISPDTKLTLIFHRYIDNKEDEILAKEFSNKHGLNFTPVYAVHMPVETLELKKLPIHSKLCFPIKWLKFWRIFKFAPCGLMHNNLALNFEGRFSTCCATTYAPYGSYLEAEKDEKIKVSADKCIECRKKAYHLYACHMLPFENLICAVRSRRNIIEALKEDFIIFKRALHFFKKR